MVWLCWTIVWQIISSKWHAQQWDGRRSSVACAGAQRDVLGQILRRWCLLSLERQHGQLVVDAHFNRQSVQRLEQRVDVWKNLKCDHRSLNYTFSQKKYGNEHRWKMGNELAQFSFEIQQALTLISFGGKNSHTHKTMCMFQLHEHEHEFNQPHQQQCKWLCAAQQLWLLNS